MADKKDIEKRIRNLVSLKNEYLNKKEYNKVNEVQEQIRILKLVLKEVSSKLDSLDHVKTKSSNTRVDNIPEIPDVVIIDNIDITDMLHDLKTSDNSAAATEIYNSIINLCEDRKNYINRVLKKSINSYEFDTELELSSKAKQSIKSLQSHINADKNIERKISLLMNSIDSYELSKNNLKLKHNQVRLIKRIKSRKNLNEEEINDKVLEIMNSVNSYVIKKKRLKLKPRVKKSIMPEAFNSIDSYIIDKSCLKLRPKVKQLITSLKSRKDLSNLEIEERITKILDSVSSYSVCKEGLELKSKVKQSITSLKSCSNLSDDEITLFI